MNHLKILLIDPDDLDAVVTEEHISEFAPGLFEVSRARSIKELYGLPAAPRFDVCVVDLDLKKNDDLEDLSWLCGSYCPDSAVIVYAARGTEENGLAVIRRGAEDFWVKGDVEPENFAWGLRRAFERKRREAVLRLKQVLLGAILDSMDAGVASADAGGNLTFFNKAASRLAGKGITDSTPNTWQETYGIYRPDRLTPCPGEETPLFQAIQGQAVDDEQLFLQHSELPEGRLVSLNARPLTDDVGRKIGGVVTFREVLEDTDK